MTINSAIRWACAFAILASLHSPAAATAAEHGPDTNLDAPPPGAFTIVVIPDTQNYVGRGTKRTPDSTEPVHNDYFATHTQWIVDNLERQRIVFVSHVGDIVEDDVDQEWKVARECLDQLHGKVPYGLTVGNHDMDGDGDSSQFQKYFPAERFREFAWYGGCFEPARPQPTISGNNANSFQLFSAGDMDFVFLHLECNAPDDVLAWANEVLTKHAARRAIVTTHMDLGPIEEPKKSRDFFDSPKGKMRWIKIHGSRGNHAVQMWDKCFRKHANLFAICCGDQSRSTTWYEKNTGDAGNTVHEMLSDYGSKGSLRLLRFVPSADEIRVITYDTTQRTLTESHKNAPQRERHQFTLAYEMKNKGK